MIEYIVFTFLMLALIIVFILLWKKRKSKNAELLRGSWQDPLFQQPEDFS
jgi:hypothetical protein